MQKLEDARLEQVPRLHHGRGPLLLPDEDLPPRSRRTLRRHRAQRQTALRGIQETLRNVIYLIYIDCKPKLWRSIGLHNFRYNLGTTNYNKTICANINNSMTLFTIFMIGMLLVSCSKEINESFGDRALGN